jgi:outer membrane lipoprotein
LSRDRSEGRFIACRAGFYDPAVFTAGREVTIAGTVTGFEARRIGDYDYRYPRVAADVIYLWPERRDRDVIVERTFFVW